MSSHVDRSSRTTAPRKAAGSMSPATLPARRGPSPGGRRRKPATCRCGAQCSSVREALVHCPGKRSQFGPKLKPANCGVCGAECPSSQAAMFHCTGSEVVPEVLNRGGGKLKPSRCKYCQTPHPGRRAAEACCSGTHFWGPQVQPAPCPTCGVELPSKTAAKAHCAGSRS